MKILIVDDHRLFCEGLRFVLQKLGDGVEILEANDHDSALAVLAENIDLDFVMLDLHLADKDGFSVLEYARKHHKSLPVVVLTGSKEVTDMRRAIDGGALGFVPKDSSGEQMLVAVRVVLAGGVYLPADMNEVARYTELGPAVSLTPRQREVLKLLIEGQLNKQIADALGITEATVKMHVSGIFKELHVSTRTQAVLKAQKMSLEL